MIHCDSCCNFRKSVDHWPAGAGMLVATVVGSWMRNSLFAPALGQGVGHVVHRACLPKQASHLHQWDYEVNGQHPSSQVLCSACCDCQVLRERVCPPESRGHFLWTILDLLLTIPISIALLWLSPVLIPIAFWQPLSKNLMPSMLSRCGSVGVSFVRLNSGCRQLLAAAV